VSGRKVSGGSPSKYARHSGLARSAAQAAVSDRLASPDLVVASVASASARFAERPASAHANAQREDSRPFEVIPGNDQAVRQRSRRRVEHAETGLIDDAWARQILSEGRPVVVGIPLAVRIDARRHLVRQAGL